MHIVKGRFEVPIVRFFSEERYAVDFAHAGRVRLTRLECFHEVEGASRDASEGTGRVASRSIPFVTVNKAPVDAAIEVVATNPIYVLSFSESTVDLQRLARDFGTHLVRILEPELLNLSLPHAVFDLPDNHQLVSLRITPVRYDRGGLRNIPDMQSALPLAFDQKPAEFEHEREWRVVAVVSPPKLGAPHHLHARIPLTTHLRVERL